MYIHVFPAEFMQSVDFLMYSALFFFAVLATLASGARAWWDGPFTDPSSEAAWLRGELVRTIPNATAVIDFAAAGGIADDTSYDAASINGILLHRLLREANATTPACDTCLKATVHIPASMQIWLLPLAAEATMDGLSYVALQIDGYVNAFNGSHALWPNITGTNRARCVIDIRNSAHIWLVGSGTINGHGFSWWVDVIDGASVDNRPHLVRVATTSYVHFEGLTLRDSPMYHVKWFDIYVGLVQRVTVHVDVIAQRDLMRRHLKWGLPLVAQHHRHVKKIYGGEATLDLPTFPLNTDGIDVRGKWIVVVNCHVENFDDSLCVKPMTRQPGFLTSCSENIYIAHSTINLGVGSTIGSVPPSVDVTCVRNVTFFNITAHYPIKGIYVKPNPGTSGRGIVDRVRYVNYTGYNPLWWSIWVSTQQQAQPHGGADTHCSFFYPLPGQSCPTQPLVPVTNLQLTNVLFKDALLSPGVLRCNASGPCTGWVWDNVQSSTLSGWPLDGNNYLCAALPDAVFNNVNGRCVNSTALSLQDSMNQMFVANRFLAQLWRRLRQSRS